MDKAPHTINRFWSMHCGQVYETLTSLQNHYSVKHDCWKCRAGRRPVGVARSCASLVNSRFFGIHPEHVDGDHTYSPLSPQLSLLSQVHRERATTSRTYEGASVLGKGHPFNPPCRDSPYVSQGRVTSFSF